MKLLGLICIWAISLATIPTAIASGCDIGTMYVPVVVRILVGTTGFTNGMQVKLIEVGESEKNLELDDPALSADMRNLMENLGKPVLTDRNSTATVWMKSRWVCAGEPALFRRKLRGRLVIGPDGAPLYDKPLIEIIRDLDEEECSQSPVLIEVTLDNYLLSEPERAPGSKQEQNQAEHAER